MTAGSVAGRGPLLPVVGVLSVLAYAGLLSWTAERTSYDAWAAVLVAPVLIALVVPVALRVARRGDPWLARLLMAGIVVKLLGALLRYAVVFGLYGGVADAETYHIDGIELAKSFRHLIFEVHIGSSVVGTGFIKILTGLVYAVIGPTRLGGFLVFAWLSYMGFFFCIRAFQIGCPQGSHRRYAALVLFLPSLVFWPSSVGKDAWMTFGIGLAALGAARILTKARGGYLILALGLGANAMVRPHISALLIAALGTAYLLRRTPKERRTAVTPVAKMAGILAILLVAVIVVRQTQHFLGVESLSADSVSGILADTQARTNEGGSGFRTVSRITPKRLPAGIVSVIFRPFPWEAHNAQALASALEGAFLGGLFVLSRRRLYGLPAALRASPYVVFAIVYAMLFAVVFSSFSNLGILARERVQMLPFLVVLLAIPPRPRVSRSPVPVPPAVPLRAPA